MKQPYCNDCNLPVKWVPNDPANIAAGSTILGSWVNLDGDYGCDVSISGNHTSQTPESYFVDKTSTEKIDGYSVWQVRTSDGTIACKFIGGMGLLAAASFAEAMNKGTMNMEKAADMAGLH